MGGWGVQVDEAVSCRSITGARIWTCLARPPQLHQPQAEGRHATKYVPSGASRAGTEQLLKIFPSKILEILDFLFQFRLSLGSFAPIVLHPMNNVEYNVTAATEAVQILGIQSKARQYTEWPQQ